MAVVVEITAKAKAAKVKSAPTAQGILIPADEIAAYRTLVESLMERYSPASRQEKVLVQSLADIEWRLSRIPSLEAGIYEAGRRDIAEHHSDYEDPATRAALIEAEIFMKYQREFSDLSLQEARLLRLRRKTLAGLREAIPTSSNRRP
jgi:hypothetical protein